MTNALGCSLIHIVEDDDAVREALGFLIESSGASVMSHRSAEDFLAATLIPSPQVPTCVLLDLHLGGQSGAELLEQLNRRHHETPVIVLTAHAHSELAERALLAGARRVIEKPFHSGELIRSITDVLTSG